MSDNPNVRNATLCPLCHGDKSRGLVACWPCFRKHDMRNGNRDAEEKIAAYDEMIAMGLRDVAHEFYQDREVMARLRD